MEVLLILLATAVPVAVGLVVAGRQRLIGGLLVLHGISVGAVLAPWFEPDTQADLVRDQLFSGAWIFLFLWIALIGYLLPDGRPLTQFWSRWLLVGLAGAGCFVIGAVGSDPGGFRAEHGGAAPPVPWLPSRLSELLGVVGLLLVVLLLFGSVVAAARRLSRSQGEVRKQLLWLVLGVVPVPVTLIVGWTYHFLLDADGGLTFLLVLTFTAVALPCCLGIAIVRHGLFDIEVVLSRTLAFVTLVAGAVGAYAGLLVLTDRLFGRSEIVRLIAIAVVAVGLQPVYGRVLRRIERWVYGYRSEPHLAMRLLADRADAADPDGLIEAVTTAVAEALRAERVWIGPADTGEPLMHRGERLGDLAVEMPTGRTIGRVEEGLLRDLARYAATIVQAERLHSRLRESRREIIEGREEERRRLRRDLHDGVGPSLAAIVLLLDAAASRTDEAEREGLIREAGDEVKEAIREVRRAVDDLRPPAIDEVGLVDAIRQRAASLNSRVVFEVHGPDRLGPLPAAVEVAAFRIASEAMTNVARHSRAGRCRVEIDVNGAFELLVSDNGTGETAPVTRGVGWTSMRERAAELGGECTIGSRPDGGWSVRAVLPLGDERSLEVSG